MNYDPNNSYNRDTEQQNAWHYESSGQSWQYRGEQMPPINNPFEGQKSARTAQTLGIVALVISLVLLPPVGIVLGILAIARARAAKRSLGYEISEARVGRICGIIAIVVGGVSIVANVFLYILAFLIFLSPTFPL